MIRESKKGNEIYILITVKSFQIYLYLFFLFFYVFAKIGLTHLFNWAQTSVKLTLAAIEY